MGISKLSVCIATYNGAKFISEQLESIVTQLSKDDEILISDDGSIDNTILEVLKFNNKVCIVATERAGGVVANFERVLLEAKGDGIVLCDQDDVWLPGRLDIIRYQLIQHHLVIINGLMVDENLDSINKTIFNELNVRPGFITNLIKNSFIGCCMALRRDLVDCILPFPKKIPWHDWYIGLAAEMIGSIARVDSISMLYRRHSANSSPTGEKSRYSLWRKLQMRYSVLRAVLVVLMRRRIHF